MKTLVKLLPVAFFLAFVGFPVAFAATSTGNQPKPANKVLSYESSLYTDAEGKLRIAIDKLVGGIVEVRLINSKYQLPT